MELVLELIKNESFLSVFSRIIIVMFSALGTVYVFGRMLGVIKSDVFRNILAVLSIFGFHYFYTRYIKAEDRLPVILYETLAYGNMTVVLYVLFGWRLFGRIDSFLNKHFGKDNFNPNKSKRRKSSGKTKKSTERKIRKG